MDTEYRYVALIGDIVASREMASAERSNLQQTLSAEFAKLEPDVETGVASRPLMTLGDEFQGLFHADSAGTKCVLAVIKRVANILRPRYVRFGLGLGTLSTPLRDEAIGMDGPCFHNARRALDNSRRTGLLCMLSTPERSHESPWSALASYYVKQRLDWTEAQAEAIAAYEHLQSWTEVARSLQVSKGAISHRTKAAGWILHAAAHTGLLEGLMRIISCSAENRGSGGTGS